jgi:hypothetical protein
MGIPEHCGSRIATFITQKSWIIGLTIGTERKLTGSVAPDIMFEWLIKPSQPFLKLNLLQKDVRNWKGDA